MRGIALWFLLVLMLSAGENHGQNLQDIDQDSVSGKTVVLVHGYGKGPKDMACLAGFLEDAGYHSVPVDLPLTFDHVQEAAGVFSEKVGAILSELPDDASIAMVGHSTGGLVIRYFLSHSPDYKRVDHAVLIATPNKGSKFAQIAGEVSDLLVETFATLDSLRPENVAGLALSDPEAIRVGAIAGNKNDMLLGRFLENRNDGRVEVESVYYPELDDFAVVAFNHDEILHRKETALLVIRFLESGSFDGKRETETSSTGLK